jgi:hypothetical protein
MSVCVHVHVYVYVGPCSEQAVLKIRLYRAKMEMELKEDASVRGNVERESYANVTIHNDIVLRPFVLACNFKANKLTLLALSGIQKLLSLNPVPSEFLSTCISVLQVQTGTTTDQQVCVCV